MDSPVKLRSDKPSSLGRLAVIVEKINISKCDFAIEGITKHDIKSSDRKLFSKIDSKRKVKTIRLRPRRSTSLGISENIQSPKRNRLNIREKPKANKTHTVKVSHFNNGPSYQTEQKKNMANVLWCYVKREGKKLTCNTCNQDLCDEPFDSKFSQSLQSSAFKILRHLKIFHSAEYEKIKETSKTYRSTRAEKLKSSKIEESKNDSKKTNTPLLLSNEKLDNCRVNIGSLSVVKPQLINTIVCKNMKSSTISSVMQKTNDEKIATEKIQIANASAQNNDRSEFLIKKYQSLYSKASKYFTIDKASKTTFCRLCSSTLFLSFPGHSFRNYLPVDLLGQDYAFIPVAQKHLILNHVDEYYEVFANDEEKDPKRNFDQLPRGLLSVSNNGNTTTDKKLYIFDVKDGQTQKKIFAMEANTKDTRIKSENMPSLRNKPKITRTHPNNFTKAASNEDKPTVNNKPDLASKAVLIKPTDLSKDTQNTQSKRSKLESRKDIISHPAFTSAPNTSLQSSHVKEVREIQMENKKTASIKKSISSNEVIIEATDYEKDLKCEDAKNKSYSSMKNKEMIAANITISSNEPEKNEVYTKEKDIVPLIYYLITNLLPSLIFNAVTNSIEHLEQENKEKVSKKEVLQDDLDMKIAKECPTQFKNMKNVEKLKEDIKNSWQDKLPSSDTDNKVFSSFVGTSKSNDNPLNTADTKHDTVKTEKEEKKAQNTLNKSRKFIALGVAASVAQHSTQDSAKSQQLSNKSSSANSSVSSKSNLDIFEINDDNVGQNLKNSQQPPLLVQTEDHDKFESRRLSSIDMGNKSTLNGNFDFGKPISNSTSANSSVVRFSSEFEGSSSDIPTKNNQNLSKSEEATPTPVSFQETSTGSDLATTANNTKTKTTKYSNLEEEDSSDSLTAILNMMSAPQLQGSIEMRTKQSLFGGPASLIGITSPSNTLLPVLQPTSNLNPFQPSHQSSALMDIVGEKSDSLTSMTNLMSSPKLQESTGIEPQQSLFGEQGGTTSDKDPSKTLLPVLQPTSNINPLQPLHQANPSSLIGTPILAPTEFNFSNSVMISGSVHQQDKKAAQLSSACNVGSLNMDLANASLSDRNSEKAAMSMDTMKILQSDKLLNIVSLDTSQDKEKGDMTQIDAELLRCGVDDPSNVEYIYKLYLLEVFGLITKNERDWRVKAEEENEAKHINQDRPAFKFLTPA